MKQVLVGIGGYAQFRKKRDRGVTLGSAAGQVQSAFDVVGAVRHANIRNGYRHAQETVRIN